MDSASLYFGIDSHFIRMKESEKTFHVCENGLILFSFSTLYKFHFFQEVQKFSAKMVKKDLPRIFTVDVDAKWHIPYSGTKRTVTKGGSHNKIIYIALKMTDHLQCIQILE